MHWFPAPRALLDAAQLGVFNHTSYVDAVTMMWLLTPSGVSKASNADIPLLGTPLMSGRLDLCCRVQHCSPFSC